MSNLREASQRKGTFLQSMKAVAWSFFGVRKSADHAKDVSQLNPIHVILAGLLCAAIFVASLLLVVKWVVAA
jgi:hypothetical protein